LEAAAQTDAAPGLGEGLGLLAGVPFGIKDMENASGLPTMRGPGGTLTRRQPGRMTRAMPKGLLMGRES
jgi:Asp-tRNA(Asn)/Glu-tRNA(Gln) amidotransferase A subunit family amidase